MEIHRIPSGGTTGGGLGGLVPSNAKSWQNFLKKNGIKLVEYIFRLEYYVKTHQLLSDCLEQAPPHKEYHSVLASNVGTSHQVLEQFIEDFRFDINRKSDTIEGKESTILTMSVENVWKFKVFYLTPPAPPIQCCLWSYPKIGYTTRLMTIKKANIPIGGKGEN